MSRNPELDALKSQIRTSSKKKQDTWQQYNSAKDKAQVSEEAMKSAWQERLSAKEKMNHEYHTMRAQKENYEKTWDEYDFIRDCNKSRIVTLRREASAEHEKMRKCFSRANSERNFGSESKARAYADEGREHKTRRDELNAEIHSIQQETQNALEDAKTRAPKTDFSNFYQIKEEYEQIRARHNVLQKEFKALKAERDKYETEFKQAETEYERSKQQYQAKLAELKANGQFGQDEALNKVVVRYFDRKDAVAIKKRWQHAYSSQRKRVRR